MKVILEFMLGATLTVAAMGQVQLSLDVYTPASPLKCGDKFIARLFVDIASDWHIASLTQPDGGPERSVIELANRQPVKIAGPITSSNPKVEFNKIFDMNVETYTGTVVFTLPLVATEDIKPGAKLTVQITYQACNDETCLLPRTEKASAELVVTLRAEDGATDRIEMVKILTDLGEITVEIDSKKAPMTAANFLRYIDAGMFDGGLLHRTVTSGNQPGHPVKIEVVQAAINPARQSEEYPPIALERTAATGLRHLGGTISMARDGPDSATSDFFICLSDQPELDFGGKRNPDGEGFAAFGRVVEGMDVVRRIHSSPAQGQKLEPPVRIISARRK